MTNQRRSRMGRPVLMEELDIPIFFIRRLGDRQFIVGGGGGSAKTGVPNAVYLFSMTIRKDRCYLRQSQKVETGTSNPMNIAVFEVTSSSLAPIFIDPRTRLPSITPEKAPNGSAIANGNTIGHEGRPLNKMQQAEKEILTMLTTVRELVAIGLDNTCAIYQISRSLPQKPQHDHRSLAQPVISKEDLISILARQTIETLKGADAVQQCCAFIPPLSLKRGQEELSGSQSTDARLATGGSDGFIRFWAGPDFQSSRQIKAHNDEITDMDVSPLGDEIITCGRDKKAHVWKIKSGELVASAEPDFSEAKTVAYRPRKVRFHCKDPSLLYVIWIPVVRQRKRQDFSVLCVYKFRASRLALVNSRSMTGELLSALAVSPDGYYLATGNLDGTVCILRNDLSIIYTAVSAHETFVTDLEFADCTFGAKILTQTENAQCTVFSVSADRRIVLHQTDFRDATLKSCRKVMKWVMIIWFCFLIYNVANLFLKDVFPVSYFPYKN